MGSQQLYSLSWGEFGTSLTSTVQVLRGHGEMVDVTLAAGGRIFPAHKLVLSAASPLLMELLKSTHCHHPVVMLAGITAPDLEALLQFVYQGEVSVDPTQLPSLLQAAHCLDIQALSPQTLTTEKTMTQITVPVVMNDGMREMNHGQNNVPMRDMNSPLLPVRKRKRKQRHSSETDGVKWAVTEGIGVGGIGVGVGVTVESRPMEHVEIPVDEHMKDELVEDQHCNGEPPTTKKLVSDLPVECTVCGVTLRQSRNLRRHMELIHLKVENGGKQRKIQTVKDETKKPEEENIQNVPNVQSVQSVQNVQSIQSVQNVQNVQSVQTLTEVVEGGVEAGPSRLPPPAPPSHLLSPPLYHSSTQCDPYSHTMTQQFTHDSVFRQHQTELLRGAGLYADTREHCATE